MCQKGRKNTKAKKNHWLEIQITQGPKIKKTEKQRGRKKRAINYNEKTKICKTKEQKHERKKLKRRAESFKTKGHEVRQYDDELTERREQ